MTSQRLLPCPFCGTNPEDEDCPANTLHGGGVSLECGKCGACWPTLTEDIASEMDSDDDFTAFLNRRAK